MNDFTTASLGSLSPHSSFQTSLKTSTTEATFKIPTAPSKNFTDLSESILTPDFGSTAPLKRLPDFETIRNPKQFNDFEISTPFTVFTVPSESKLPLNFGNTHAPNKGLTLDSDAFRSHPQFPHFQITTPQSTVANKRILTSKFGTTNAQNTETTSHFGAIRTPKQFQPLLTPEKMQPSTFVSSSLQQPTLTSTFEAIRSPKNFPTSTKAAVQGILQSR